MIIAILLSIIYLIFFGYKSEYITIFFGDYKITISIWFVLLAGFIIIKLLNYLTKIFSNIISLPFNIQKIWYKRQKKELLEKLFLILYYIAIEDRKNLRSNLINIKLPNDKEISEDLFNIIKYHGGKYLNDKLIIESATSKFMASKNTKILAIKNLLEEKIENKDFDSAKALFSQITKNDYNLSWVKKYDAEIEKTSGNAGKALDKLAILEKLPEFNSEIKVKQEIKDLLLDKAKYLIETRNFCEAKKYVKKMLNIYPENIDSLSLLIEIHIKQNNRWRANRLIKKTWLISPSEKLLHQFELNNPKNKNTELRKKQKSLLEINNSLTSKMAFAKYFVDIGEFDSAKEYMNQISKKQQSPEYYRLLSEIELKTGGDLELIKKLVEQSV